MWHVFLVASVTAVATLPLTGGDSRPQLLAMAYVAVFVVAIRQPACSVAAVLVLTILSHSSSWLTPPVDVRLFGLPFVALLIGQAAQKVLWRARREDSGRPRSQDTSTAMIRLAPLVIALYGLSSAAWSINPQKSLESSAALLFTWAFCISVVTVLPLEAVTKSVGRVAWLVLGVSAAMVVFSPGTAILADRFRGLFSNPNSMACLMVVVTPILMASLRKARWPVAALIGAVTVSTASRAGAGAVALELAIFLLAGAARKLQLVVVALMGGAGVWLLVQTSNETRFSDQELLLLRDNNSRAENWTDGLSWFAERPLFGNGLSAIPPGSIAGLGPYLLATLGIVGAALAGFFLLVLLVVTLRRSTVVVALVVGSLANNIFEPWIFTGGSPFFLIFCLVTFFPSTADDPRPFQRWREVWPSRRAAPDVARP